MTAEEIRNINPKYDNTDDFYLMCLDMFCMFREIAAQLAELNAGLALFLRNTHMVTYKPDTGVDDYDD